MTPKEKLLDLLREGPTLEEFRAILTRPTLLVHRDDLETPVESLKLRVLVKTEGYLKDALESAERCVSMYVAKGDAYLVP